MAVAVVAPARRNADTRLTFFDCDAVTWLLVVDRQQVIRKSRSGCAEMSRGSALPAAIAVRTQ